MQGVQGDAPLHVHQRAAREDDHGRHGDGPRPARGRAQVQARRAEADGRGDAVQAHRREHGGRHTGGGGAARLQRPQGRVHGVLGSAVEFEGGHGDRRLREGQSNNQSRCYDGGCHEASFFFLIGVMKQVGCTDE